MIFKSHRLPHCFCWGINGNNINNPGLFLLSQKTLEIRWNGVAQRRAELDPWDCGWDIVRSSSVLLSCQCQKDWWSNRVQVTWVYFTGCISIYFEVVHVIICVGPFPHPSRHSQFIERSAVMMRDWLQSLACEGSHLELQGVSRLIATAAVTQESVTSTLHTSLACLYVGHA